MLSLIDSQAAFQQNNSDGNAVTINSLVRHIQLIYENSPFIVSFKSSENLDFFYTNKIARNYLGFPDLKSIVGKSDYDFRWQKFAFLYEKHDQDTLENNNYLVIYPTCDYSGNESLVACNKTLLEDSNGESLGILTHAYWLEDRRFLELSNLLRLTEPCSQSRSYTFGKRLSGPELTDRERECLFFYIRGKTCKLIAKILNLSYRTVEHYIDNIKTKFSCASKSDLIDAAIEQGYLYDFPASLFNKNLVGALSAS